MEDNSLLDHLKAERAKLMIAFQFDTRWLAGEMNALGLLSDNDCNKVCTVTTILDDSDKAGILISALFRKVGLQSQNLIKFVNILKKKQKIYQEIIVLLEGKYKTNISYDVHVGIARYFTLICSLLHCAGFKAHYRVCA